MEEDLKVPKHQGHMGKTSFREDGRCKAVKASKSVTPTPSVF